MIPKANKTINITESNKEWILSLRIHDRETPNDIIERVKEKMTRKDGVIIVWDTI